MDACSINWDLVSKFIPLVTGLITIGIAIFVYKVWHKQKEKEVFANEAKILLGNLFELDALLVEKKDSAVGAPDYIAIEANEQSIKKAKELIDIMIPRLNFINEKIDLTQLIEKLKEIYKKLNSDNNKLILTLPIDCQRTDKYSVAKSEIKRLYKPLKNVACYKKP
ncbi:hypothetical protein EAH57_02875 [Acinetobacter sp. 2JN-4]|uniref:hypothetical protein n=1 Tax=Acinetobacter sp. 2JN-4 TaxID=2479844 RepID=UPI000EF96FA0|nr:hypothetical protein [Acinetobacter sp. 2JN-4]RLZ11327.1 hypothetical protein EAH57_02875 [Acinetobacter sp. 2JN-4]